MTLDEQAEAIARHFERVRDRLGDDAATFRGLIDSGVILPGPAVTEDIEEAE